MKSGKRATIGFLLGKIDDRYQAVLWPEVVRTAAERNADLYCFVGKPLKSPYGYEAVCNSVYDLVNSSYLDGLVVLTGTLGAFVFPSEMEQFCRRFSPLPMVSIPLRMNGIPSVEVDNSRGIYDAVSHLIEKHGHKRIAFIRGPEGHPEAEERFAAYRDALSKHGLPYDQQLVAPGDFDISSGRKAARLLLKERSLRFDSAVAANDEMALGAIEEFRNLGVRVPRDIGIIGFDDVDFAKYSHPPLTTIRQPLAAQARKATELLLDMIEGKRCDPVTRLSTELVIRESCGCFSEALTEIRQDVRSKALRSWEAENEAVLDAMSNILYAPGDAEGRKKIAALTEAFALSVNEGKDEPFLQAISEFFSTGGRHWRYTPNATEGDSASGSTFEQSDTAPANLHRLLTQLRHAVRNVWGIEGDEGVTAYERNSAFAETVLLEARVLVGEIEKRIQANLVLADSTRSNVLREVGQRLSTALETEELFQAAAEEMKRLEVPGCYVVRSKETDGMDGGSATLAFAYANGGRIHLDANVARTIAKGEVLPSDVVSGNQRLSSLVLPLHFKEERLGHIVFQLGPFDGVLYESLRGYFSGALKSSGIVSDMKKTDALLRASDERLKALVLPMIETLARITGATREKQQTLQRFSELLRRSHDDLRGTEADIRQVRESASRMKDMVKVVDDIASGVNIMALNAAITSARAGAAGKAFAVIAAEIRHLSDSTQHEAENMSSALTQIVKDAAASDEMGSRALVSFQTLETEAIGLLQFLEEIDKSLRSLSENGQSILDMIKR